MSTLDAHLPVSRTHAPVLPRFSGLAVVLLAAVLLNVFIGLSPFPGTIEFVLEQKTAGSLRTQIVWSLFTFVGLIVISVNQQRTVALLKQSAPLLILLALCAISISWAPVPEIALRRFVRLLFVVIVVVSIVVGMGSPRIVHRIGVLVSGVAMIINLIGVFIIPHLARDASGQFIGMYSHKNTAGMITMITIFLWLSAFRWSRSDLQRAFYLFGSCLWFAFLLGTQSKSAISLTIAIPLIAIAFQYSVKNTRMGIPASLSLSAVLCFGAYFALLGDYSFLDVIGLFFPDLTFTGRTIIWDFVLPEISRRPLLGIGFDSFWGIGAEGISARFGTGLVTHINQAHNGYLDILLTLGALGLTLTIVFVASGFVASIRVLKLDGAANRYPETVEFCVYVLFAALINNITESSLLRASHAMNLFLMLSILILYSGLLQAMAGSMVRGNKPKTQGPLP